MALTAMVGAPACADDRVIVKKGAYEGPPAGPYRLGGLSFTTEPNVDVLRMSAPVGVTPEVYRHAVPQRIVLRFDNTQALENLISLASGKRGDCVEKIEIQTLRNDAVGVGDEAGVRTFSTYSTLVVAYIPADVDAQVTTDAGVIEVVFQRIRGDATQITPMPVNTLEDIYFESLGNKEIITFVFTQPITPAIYEEAAPHRLLLRMPDTDISVRSMNRIRRFMQTPLLFRVEALNVGSAPNPYPEMDMSRDFHFNNYPSPLADDAFADKVFGKQTRDIIVALYPFENVYFELPQTEKNWIKIVFEKTLDIEPAMTCTKFEPVRTIPELLYPVESEEGIIILEDE